MPDIRPMDVEMAHEIADAIQYRIDTYDEPLDYAAVIVLLNYGDRDRTAYCTTGDWTGPKREMERSPSGLPVCPKCGHVATEDEHAPRLALGVLRPIHRMIIEAGAEPWSPSGQGGL